MAYDVAPQHRPPPVGLGPSRSTTPAQPGTASPASSSTAAATATKAKAGTIVLLVVGAVGLGIIGWLVARDVRQAESRRS